MNDIIAYQGFDGAYSHLSCRHVFPDMKPMACGSFVDAMRHVENGNAKLAMIPLENSTAGRVEEIYRELPKTRLHIIGEHFEPVNHCLLGLNDATLEDIKTVGSHPQAIAQCQEHIRNLGLEPVAKLDTAGAALEVKNQNNPSCAAIASSLAAELYGLKILRENFQDVDGNTTRFLILSKDEVLPDYRPGTHFITSIIFRLRNIPAALYKVLGGFATNNVNLVKLESYMAGGNLSYCQFHLDAMAHPQQRSMQLAIEELRFFAEEVRLLGTYQAHPFRTDHELID